MQILAVANIIPMRDRSTGWYRFYHLLRVLAEDHEVHLHPFDLEWQYKYYGKEAIIRYQDELEILGVRITTGKWADLSRLMRVAWVDIVFIEHYTAAKDFLDHVRFWQPRAKVIIDSIDIAFNRLYSKALLTREPPDLQLAQTAKMVELSVYSRSDMVIAISHADQALLAKEDANLRIEVIPLIYATPSLERTNSTNRRNLMFIGNFEHDPNVDGIVYFCTQVLPLIRSQLPDIRLRIVGESPPDVVRELAGPNVEVLGYVSDLRAVYASSDVAIAPMRFGGGLKGKIAEAMSYGVPVVTNSVGLEGFGLSPGKDVLVGDNPADFAHAVVQMLQDATLYQVIREGGWNYVRTHYSEDVVATMLNDLLVRSQQYPAKKLAISKWIRWKANHLLEKHVFWRFRRGAFEGSR